MLTVSAFKPVIAVTLALAISTEIVVFYIKVQETTNLIATARNAAEEKKADADKLFAEASEAHEIAKNAQETQGAEAKTAEQKAETQYQAAVNAERRAEADADKMEALATTAKQKALNAVLRSKAEATKMVAAVNDLRAKLQMLKSYPYNCHKQNTFKECVEALQRATNNGHWQKPDDVSSSAATATPKVSVGRVMRGIAYNHNYQLGDKYNTLEECSAYCAKYSNCLGGTYYPGIHTCFFVVNALQSQTHPNGNAISFKMERTASTETKQ